jgi:hypothetical protein
MMPLEQNADCNWDSNWISFFPAWRPQLEFFLKEVVTKFSNQDQKAALARRRLVKSQKRIHVKAEKATSFFTHPFGPVTRVEPLPSFPR